MMVYTMELHLEAEHENEKHLIDAAVGGELDAFNALVLKYQDSLYQQAYWMMHSREAAEDITQEALIKAFRRLGSYRGGSFRSWLLRILINTAIDEMRRAKNYEEVPLTRTTPEGEEVDSEEWLEDSGISIENTVEQAELSAQLRRHLDELAEKYRTVVVLIDLQGLDYSEAADVLRVPIGTVKSRLARARMQLHDRLEALDWRAQYVLS